MFFPAQRLIAELKAFTTVDLPPAQRQQILAPYYQFGEGIVKIALLVHFGLAMWLASFYDTWAISISVALVAVTMFFLSAWALPGSFFTRCMAGKCLQIFVALHIYQLHGLEEMHFFFFTSFIIMIAMCDAMAMWPGAVCIILQHIWFAWLTNSGVEVYFFPTKPVGFWKLFFHFGIALVFVGICGLWAILLRNNILRAAVQRAATARLAAVAEQTSNAVVLTDLSSRITWANNSFVELIGQPVEQIIGRSLASFLHTDDNIDLKALTNNEIRYVRRDGQQRWMTQAVSPIIDDQERLQGYIIIHTDVTQQRLATQALYESEARFRQLVERLELVFWIYDVPTQRHLYVSPAFEKIWGRSLANVDPRDIHQFWLQTIHPDDRPTVLAKMRKFQSNRQCQLEYRIVRPDGSERIVAENEYAIFNESGMFTRIVGIAQDVTEQRAAEREQAQLRERMQNAQRLESLGVLAGGIAHDFNNLLTVIMGFTAMARDSRNDPEQVDALLGNVETAAQRAAELTQQILAYSGKGRLVVEVVNLNRLIREIGVFLGSVVSRRGKLILNLEDDLPPIVADATQIRQVVLNLITNAADAIEGRPHGQVVVTTSLKELEPKDLASKHMQQSLPGGRYVCLEVVDNGCGMSAETIQRIFDPFFTTKFTGRGLGLAAVLGIIRGHQGTIHVHSEPGKGSRFTIYLPAKPDSVQRAATTPAATAGPAELAGAGAAAAADADAPRRETATILIAEDDETVRKIAVMSLTQRGFEVLEAEDGLVGCELFTQHAEQIRLVILDMIMPHRNGLDMLKFVRGLRPNVPVLVISGYSEQEILPQVAEHQVDGFLHKPFRMHEIVQAVQKICRDSNHPVTA
jgi:two-component system cell cycle sensor histidine kinase/response regulator CckA